MKVTHARLIALVLSVALFAAVGCSPSPEAPPAGTSSEAAVVVPTDSATTTEALQVLALGGGPEAFDPAVAIANGASSTIAEEIAAARSEAFAALSRCMGRNGVRKYSSWWQGTVVVAMLNSCNASRLAAALAGGAGIAALVGILSVAGAVPGGIVAAVLAIGSAAIWYCSSNGTGLEIHQAYYGSWCTNQ